MIDPEKLAAAAPRLERERNIWLCTVRADGRPHLIPIWFVWHDQKVWVCTPAGTQKHVNIQRNPHVAAALEDGATPIILEGLAAERNDPATREALNPVFMRKYEWDFVHDDDADYLLIAITPTKLLAW